MPNVTISMDEKTLEESRAYARANGMSLNALIREILQQRVRRSSTQWIDECFELMDSIRPSSRGAKWNRDDLYEL